ncbi:MAG: bifunctional metallophosphatase/5'-nucleotidase [Cyanobacteria bacterium]|nr:bifunctional metallophosphatase/5'-nucleotidase [Cyanobacteriota bacterium]
MYSVNHLNLISLYFKKLPLSLSGGFLGPVSRLGLLLLTFSWLIVGEGNVDAASPSSYDAKVPSSKNLPSAAWVQIRLLQLNDVYEYNPSFSEEGSTSQKSLELRPGLARIKTLIDLQRQSAPYSLFILAGDTLSPSLASKFYQGGQMVKVWNAMGLDLASLGNHEFDFGPDVLKKRMKESSFLWMAANVKERKTHQIFGKMPPYYIQSIPMGDSPLVPPSGGNGKGRTAKNQGKASRGTQVLSPIKIGYFSLLTPDTQTSSFPGQDVVIEDPIQTATQVVAQLKKEGATVIIAITHLPMAQDQALAKLLPIDLILGGHEHEVLQSFAGKAPILKVGSDAYRLGRVDVFISSQTRHVDHIDTALLPVDNSILPDHEVLKVTQAIDTEMASKLSAIVGTSKTPLNAEKEVNRTQETGLGNLITDAFREETGAQLAFYNSGAIRSNRIYPPGPFLLKDLWSVMPFDNVVQVVSISGHQLRKALEHSVQHAPSIPNGGFLQVSGCQFTYDPSRPVGARVVSVLVGGAPMQEDSFYSLATTDFLLGGGDGYDMLKFEILKGQKLVMTPSKIDSQNSTEPLTASGALEKYWRKKSVLAPSVEGRIQVLLH